MDWNGMEWTGIEAFGVQRLASGDPLISDH
jgi:hypothetical protein